MAKEKGRFCNVTNRNRNIRQGLRSAIEGSVICMISAIYTANQDRERQRRFVYSLGSNMGLPLHYSSGTAAAVLNTSSLDVNLLHSFTRHFEKPLRLIQTKSRTANAAVFDVLRVHIMPSLSKPPHGPHSSNLSKQAGILADKLFLIL
jgi:hypothetical protein